MHVLRPPGLSQKCEYKTYRPTRTTRPAISHLVPVIHTVVYSLCSIGYHICPYCYPSLYLKGFPSQCKQNESWPPLFLTFLVFATNKNPQQQQNNAPHKKKPHTKKTQKQPQTNQPTPKKSTKLFSLLPFPRFLLAFNIRNCPDFFPINLCGIYFIIFRSQKLQKFTSKSSYFTGQGHSSSLYKINRADHKDNGTLKQLNLVWFC